MAETGDTPRKITNRILKPLQKPNKAKDPLSYLRLIILLSSLCIILAACFISESNIDSMQKYHHQKQPTDQIDQQLNISSILNKFIYSFAKTIAKTICMWK